MGAVTSAGTRTVTKSYERPEPGVYPARCIQTVELGRHKNRFYNPDTDRPEQEYRSELLIAWELSELMQDGRPFTVSWRDRNSISEKSNLFKLLTSWRGKGFTPAESHHFPLYTILDSCCYLNLVESPPDHNSRIWINVKSAIPLPKGIVCDPRYNELIDFGIGDIDTPLFGQLWPWVQEYIKKSVEGEALQSRQALPGGGPTWKGDEVPYPEMQVPF